MKPIVGILVALGILLTACTSVDLEAPIPVVDTAVDVEAWVDVPAGEFLYGQFNDPAMVTYEYQIMVTDVTVTQYVDFLNTALRDGSLKIPLWRRTLRRW